MKKRILSALLALSLLLVAACGTPPASSASAAPSTASSVAPAPSEAPKPAYPTKPVEIVMAASAGGGTDLQIRAIAPFFSKKFGQELIPIAAPGGSGVIGMTQIKDSPTDGHTLGVPYTGGVSIMPSYGETTYTADSFEYICQYSNSPIVLVVNAKGNIKSVDDLIAAGKEKSIMYSCAPNGAIDLAIQAFAMKSGIKMVNVPAEGATPSITNVLGNQVVAAGVHPVNIYGYIESGDLLPLITFEAKRVPKLPDVPTAKELGVDMVVSVWNGIMVPKGVDTAIVEQLRTGFAEILADPACVAAIEALGSTVDYLSASDLKVKIDGEVAMFKDLIANTPKK